MITGVPVECAATRDVCGEGVLWCAGQELVYWTDINRFLIHCYHPSSKAVRTWQFSEPVTSVLLTDQPGTFLVCLASGTILWEPASDKRTPHGFQLPHWPAVRLNDAAIAPDGSLFVGSMRNNVNPDGSARPDGGQDGILFRVAPDGASAECERDIGISNTIVWSPDQKTFYFADSLANTIWSYRYDPSAGDIGDRKVFFRGFQRGKPDGSAIDKDGYLWNCRYGGHCIVRLSPDGKIDTVVEMPTMNITNCTFGGPNLSKLYITTAASTKRDESAGNLFSMNTQTGGLPENRFPVLSAAAR